MTHQTAVVGLFTVKYAQPDELACFNYALDSLRPNVRAALPSLLRPTTVVFTSDIPGTPSVPKPEGLAPGGNRILVRPLRGPKGKLLRRRVAPTCLHELFHRFRLGAARKGAIEQLFGGKPWNGPGYWDDVAEAAAYWWSRVATDGRLNQASYEDRTLELDEDEYDDLLAAVLFADPAPVDPPPAQPSPGPDPCQAALDAAMASLDNLNRQAGIDATTIASLETRIAAKDAKARELEAL